VVASGAQRAVGEFENSWLIVHDQHASSASGDRVCHVARSVWVCHPARACVLVIDVSDATGRLNTKHAPRSVAPSFTRHLRLRLTMTIATRALTVPVTEMRSTEHML
jgi:hypothetical protein